MPGPNKQSKKRSKKRKQNTQTHRAQAPVPVLLQALDDRPNCAMCNNLAILRCDNCACKELYCSHLCRLADAELHNVLCATRPAFEHPPGADVVRAIVFRVSGEIEFIWIKIETKFNSDAEETWEAPVSLAQFFDTNDGPTIQMYYYNSLRQRNPKGMIELWHNDTFLLDGSRKNLAACRVVPMMNHGGEGWRDALVAMKHEDSSLKSGLFAQETGYDHMDMGDFREVVDYLTTWSMSTVVDPVILSKNYHGRNGRSTWIVIAVATLFLLIAYLVFS